MSAVATVVLSGPLVKDPEMRYTPSGKAVTALTFAVDVMRLKDSRLQKVDTIWIKVDLWEKEAENANQYLHKGSIVTVTGYLGTNSWTDRDGNPRKDVTIDNPRVKYISGFGSSSEKAEVGDDFYDNQDIPF